MSGVPVLVQFYSAELGPMGHEHLLVQGQSYAELCTWVEDVVAGVGDGQSPNVVPNNWGACSSQQIHVRWGSRRWYGWPETTVVTDANCWVIVAHLMYGDNTDQLEALIEGMYS
jgi:hypothetical protein